MSVTGGALYVSKLTTNNSKLACIDYCHMAIAQNNYAPFLKNRREFFMIQKKM
jgi:hypothetical protein